MAADNPGCHAKWLNLCRPLYPSYSHMSYIDHFSFLPPRNPSSNRLIAVNKLTRNDFNRLNDGARSGNHLGCHVLDSPSLERDSGRPATVHGAPPGEEFASPRLSHLSFAALPDRLRCRYIHRYVTNFALCIERDLPGVPTDFLQSRRVSWRRWTPPP